MSATDPKTFMRTTAWKEFDTILGALADSAQRLLDAHPHPHEQAAKVGPILGVALQLFLAEKILGELGDFKASLEPVIANFREASKLADSMVKETSRDLQ